ncbi:acid stress chaperone HdeA [Mycobacterium sp. MAA66]
MTAVVFGAGLAMVGCSPAQTGGDTTCKNFLGAEESQQTAAVAKLLKDERGKEATNLEITGTRIAVQAYCQTAGTPDSKIKQAPHL